MPAKKIIIGITGEVKAGKTTIAGFFKELGANVIDCDSIVHILLKKNGEIKEKLIKYFGQDIIKGSEVSRKILAEKAFSSFSSWKKLNEIIHPKVIRKLKAQVKFSRAKIQVIDAPLLFESGLDSFCDYIIFVKSKPEIRKKRLKAANIKWDEVLKRENYLLPNNQKICKANFVVNNNGGLEELKEKAREIFNSLKRG